MSHQLLHLIRLAPGYLYYLVSSIVLIPAFLIKAFKHRAERGAGWARMWGGTGLVKGNVLIVANGIGEARVAIQAAEQIHNDLGLFVSVLSQKSSVFSTFPEPPHGVTMGWLPYQTPWSAVLCLLKSRPQAILCVETSTNNHLVFWSHVFKVPTALFSVNFPASMISKIKKSWMKRWRVHLFDLVSTQSETYAEGIRSMGFQGPVRVDQPPCLAPSHKPFLERQWRATLNVSDTAPIILAGSTYAEEEAIVADAFRLLVQQIPDALLVVAPRLGDHSPNVGEKSDPRTTLEHRPRSKRIVILDTQGELGRLYHAASVAYVGGSFDAGIGGHTPVEALACGLPITTGPNFERQPYTHLALDAGFGEQITTADELCAAWVRQLATPRREQISLQVEQWYVAGEHTYSRLLREFLDSGESTSVRATQLN